MQDRLPKELALAGITTVAAANRRLAETYWPAHNTAFAVAPAEAGSAFVLDRTGRVRKILCLQEERRVGNNNTVEWRGRTLQIPPSPLRAHFLRTTVRVHEYPAVTWPYSMGRIGWPITIPRETGAIPPNWLREPPTTTEAVNQCATRDGQLHASATVLGFANMTESEGGRA